MSFKSSYYEKTAAACEGGGNYQALDDMIVDGGRPFAGAQTPYVPVDSTLGAAGDLIIAEKLVPSIQIEALRTAVGPIADVTVATAGDSYTSAALGDFLAALWKADDVVTVAGFTDPANNGAHKVATVALHNFTVAENLVDEAAGDAVTFTPTNPGLLTVFTAKGRILVEKIIAETDDTGVLGGTNLNLITDNAFGINSIIASEAIANLGANKTVDLNAASIKALVPFVLEDGKRLMLQSTDAHCAGIGSIRLTLSGKRITAAKLT